MKVRTFLLSLLVAPAFAEEPLSQKEALSEALYTEEVLRDREAASKQYAEILSVYRTQRAHAAAGLFRLAEIHRSQNREEEAIKFYQEYLAHFPDLDPQAGLAREHLAALGGADESSAPLSAPSAETQELNRLKGLLTTAPELRQEIARQELVTEALRLRLHSLEEDSPTLTITIHKEHYDIDGQLVAKPVRKDEKSIKEYLDELFGAVNEQCLAKDVRTVQLKASPSESYGAVQDVIDACMAAGVSGVGIWHVDGKG